MILTQCALGLSTSIGVPVFVILEVIVISPLELKSHAPAQCRLKYCTARSWSFAARSVTNVPRFLRFPVFGSALREYKRYLPELSFLIIRSPVQTNRVLHATPDPLNLISTEQLLELKLSQSQCLFAIATETKTGPIDIEIQHRHRRLE